MMVRSIVLVVFAATVVACSGADSDPVIDDVPVTKNGDVVAPGANPGKASTPGSDATKPGPVSSPSPAPGPAQTPAPMPAPATLKSCCKMDGAFRAKCAPKASVSPQLLSILHNDDDDTCNSATEVCTPTENLDPKFKPSACTADPLFGQRYTGVCLSDCFDFGAAWLEMDRGNCANAQTCVPCVRDGKATGAPGCPNP